MAPHKIPNLAYVNVGIRHVSRLMLPWCVPEEEPDRRVLPAIIKDIYNDIIKPIVTDLCPGGEGHLPASAEAEMARTSAGRGSLGTSQFPIPGRVVAKFGQQVIQACRLRPWGREAFWMHEVRGTQGATSHSLDNGDEEVTAESVLMEYTRDLDISLVDPQNWWIDQGYEIQLPGHVLLWRRDAVASMNAEGLGDAGVDEALALTYGSDYSWDEAALLHDAGGARLELAQIYHDNMDMAYMQYYSTEKRATYSPNPGRGTMALSLLAKEALMLQNVGWSATLAGIYSKAAHAQSEGFARAEIRVRLSQVGRKIFTSNREGLCRFLVAFKAKPWWCVFLHGIE
jgi:hypothetical protein